MESVMEGSPLLVPQDIPGGSDTFTPLICREHGAVIYPPALLPGSHRAPCICLSLDS